MEALFYEGLIRDVFKTKRTSENGADADIYRQMEHAHRGLSITEMNGTQSQREYEFQSKFATVRRNIREAITSGIQEIGSRGSAGDINSLETMKNALGMRFYDKAALDRIIRDAHHIFETYGMTKRS